MQEAEQCVKRIGKTKDEMYSEMSNETCKEKMRSVPDLCVISTVRGES
jgi:hypothetical protein